MTVPLPQHKPPVPGSGEGSIIDRIFDVATSVFVPIAKTEYELHTAERLAEIRQIEEAGRNSRQIELAGGDPRYSPTQQALIGGSSTLSIILLGAAFYLIVKR